MIRELRSVSQSEQGCGRVCSSAGRPHEAPRLDHTPRWRVGHVAARGERTADGDANSGGRSIEAAKAIRHIVVLRCGAFVSAGCTALAAMRLNANGMEITGMGQGRRKR